MVGFLKDSTGSFSAGMLGLAGVLVVAIGLTLSLRLFMMEE